MQLVAWRFWSVWCCSALQNRLDGVLMARRRQPPRSPMRACKGAACTACTCCWCCCTLRARRWPSPAVERNANQVTTTRLLHPAWAQQDTNETQPTNLPLTLTHLAVLRSLWRGLLHLARPQQPGTGTPHPDPRPFPPFTGQVSFTWPGASKQQLTDITCRVSLGSRVAVLGANGAGKSTLIKLLTGELCFPFWCCLPVGLRCYHGWRNCCSGHKPSHLLLRLNGQTPALCAAGETLPDEGSVWKHPNLRLAYVAQARCVLFSMFRGFMWQSPPANQQGSVRVCAGGSLPTCGWRLWCRRVETPFSQFPCLALPYRQGSVIVCGWAEVPFFQQPQRLDLTPPLLSGLPPSSQMLHFCCLPSPQHAFHHVEQHLELTPSQYIWWR